IQLIHQYRDNPHIRGIVVRIDSPGGTVGAAQEIYSEIKKVREKGKFVFASMANTAASGGYYVACAADEIYANPGTVTGSIGVILESMNYQELIQKIGVDFRVVKSGEHKDILSPTRPITEDEKRILQGLINNVYEQFVDAILEGRSVPLNTSMRAIGNSSGNFEDFLTSSSATQVVSKAKSQPVREISDEALRAFVHSIADGRIYSGEQAYRLGLVDRLGTLEDAIEAAAKRAGIEGEPRIVRYRRKPSIFDLIGGRFGAWVRSVPNPTDVSLQYRLIIR
ncbi:MAG: signal peptide peptidase SppA, partial [bacterium]